MSEKTNVRKEKNARYPAIDIEQALMYSGKLLQAYRGAAFSRENAVQGMDFKTVTGDTAAKAAALVHFGLLNRVGNTYQNSDLAMSIFHYSDEEERKEAIKVAAQNPKLFSRLINKFGGQALPARLSSILVREFEINQKVAEKVAENFKRTLEYAGLYENGVIATDPASDNNERTQNLLNNLKTFGVAIGDEDNNVPFAQRANLINSNQSASTSKAMDMIPLELPGTGITILYPASLAYSFAVGKFGSQIESLGNAVKQVISETNKADELPADNLDD